MAEQMPLMIPGVISSETTLEVYAPYNGEHLGTVPTVGAEGAMHALDTAHGLYKNRGTWLPAQERLQILEKAASIIEERADQLALGIALEGASLWWMPVWNWFVPLMASKDVLKPCVPPMARKHRWV